MRRTLLLFVFFLAACPVTVQSTGPNQPPPPPPPNRPNPPPDRPNPPPPVLAWDSTGWTMLGERTVEGRVDSDVIDVSQKLGQFNQLTVVVLDSDLEMVELNITFVRGTKYSPDVKQVFRENTRTRAIALPSREILRKIEFKYRNLPGGGRARVQVWGKLSGDAPPPPPPPVAWDSTGWTMIGERTVDGRVDNDKIDVSQKIGKFNQLTVVVLDSDLEMIDFAVQFVKGTRFNPPVSHFFRENSRTKVIDLPNTEILRRIEFKYRNLPGGGRARVQVWGRLGPERPAPPPVWDSTGWTLVGERTVDGRVDNDKIDISQKIGKINRLTVVVLDSDLEMIEFTITFVRGTKYAPEMKHVFRENTRTRTIDLPAAEILRRIEFKYRNLPGGGRARVQVWGKA
jgi:hypothetical protein